ncbi:hypothetical protein LJC25_02455 [Bacteroidales bacterium OttesenSCG-928-K03]|nr:hypothetical protein [Bacteroidales bacterium OttesenSCG-928-K22]MDL2242570.1 hypothetical protein [Bacteroidales bacterium OttesenSCG-928-K03]
MEEKKSLIELKTIDDIKMYKLALKDDILAQEETLSADIEDIKDRWNVFDNDGVNNKIISSIDKVAGYISSSFVVISKVIDIIHEGKKIYKQFNNK